MQQQTTQVRPLPAIMIQYLADHPWQFIDVDVDHDALVEIMDNEEKVALHKGIIVKQEGQRSDSNIIDHGQGTLSSRIRQLTHDCTDVTLQTEFRSLAESHPTYAKISEEIIEAVLEGPIQRDRLFDFLESIGCTVAFDKAKGNVSLGFNKGLLNKGFIEHSRLIDLRNKSSIAFVNGDQNNIFQEKEPTRHVPEPVEYKTFFLTIKLPTK